MELAVILMAAVAALELLLYGPLWRWQRLYTAWLMAALLVASVRLTIAGLDGGIVIILVGSLYRVANLWRVYQQRLQADYLYSSARRASWWLIFGQSVTLVVVVLGRQYSIGSGLWLYLLAVVQLAAVTALSLSTWRHIRTTQAPAIAEHQATRDLPTLTVAIPARNETDELNACLESLVASTYPKLEILVLDDSSQDKRTPEIIKAFAQSGVIFVPGEAAPPHWLPKNHVYKQLAGEANGELILFCGTDVRFEPGSLTAIVETLLSKHKSMLCVMPRNLLGESRFLSLLIQPSRYAWEIAPPRRLLERPPVLSSCWLITAEALRKFGGFDAAHNTIVPESYLARQAAHDHDGYSFVRLNKGQDVAARKTYGEQLETAIRTRYPQLHKRVELAALVSLVEFFVLVWPLVSLVMAVIERRAPLIMLSAAGSLLALGLHCRIITLTYRRFLLGSLFILPLAALYDLFLLNYSMLKYEFGQVFWKGRDISGPVMRVSAGLAQK